MKVIASIALNTYRESSRNKIFLVFLGLATVSILLTKIASMISPEAEEKMVIDFGLLSITFFGMVMAVFSGASLVHKDLEKKTIYTVLSKPITRFQFILGKYLGLLLSIFISHLVLSVVLICYCFLIGVHLSFAFYGAIAFIFLQVSLIASVCIFFSMISSPLLSATFTLCFYLFGYALEGIKDMISFVPFEFAKTSAEIVYFILPKLFYLDLKYQASHGLPVSAQEIVYMSVHGFSYIVFFIFCSTWLLNRKVI